MNDGTKTAQAYRPIPVAAPDLTGNEEKYVSDALRSSWISSTGPYIGRFEREFAGLCETETAISVSNGTVALQLALLTLKVGPGDEVLLPSLTYIATANAVRYVGATPVFVDVEPDTWCIDPEKARAAVTPRTKAIIAVHLYGHPADMDEINKVAREFDLWVVEDAAEAPLATYKGRPVGGLGTIGTFSFYGNKIVTCGEGGAITLKSAEHDERARLLRGQGMDPQRRYYFPVVGYNFRLTNVACAILCAQLERVNQIVQRRREIYALYRKLLGGIPGLNLQPNAPWAVLSPWLFCVTIERSSFGRSRDEVMAGLAQASIETRPFFMPIHILPPYADARCAGSLEVTEQLSATGINLPTYNGMSDEDVQNVCQTVAGLRK